MGNQTMENVKTIALPDVLKILEGENESSPVLFVNPSETLETFFNYKGKLIELNKFDMSMKLSKEKPEEVSESIRQSLCHGMKYGEWMVFAMGKMSSFDVSNFLKPFAWNNGDKDFFNNTKLFEKSYIKKMGILTDKEDVDFFDNKGCYAIKDSSKLFYFLTCPQEEIELFRKANPNINFVVYYIE